MEKTFCNLLKGIVLKQLSKEFVYEYFYINLLKQKKTALKLSEAVFLFKSDRFFDNYDSILLSDSVFVYQKLRNEDPWVCILHRPTDHL